MEPIHILRTELGSDQMFAELADTSAINHGYRLERLRLLLEEWRVRTQPFPAVDDEPGEDHPDPDDTPAGDPPEFDPLPPPA